MDLLNVDLTSIDISRPLLEGVFKVKVANLLVVPNKAGDGQNLSYTLTLAQGAMSAQGKPVEEGFPISGSISLKSTERYSEEAVMARLKQFRLCFTGEETGSFAPLDQYIGREGFVRLRREVGLDGAERTAVGAFLRPPLSAE